MTACASAPLQPVLPPETAITANLGSASFITRDLDKSVAFYERYLGYKVLGRSEVTAAKSRQVVGAVGNSVVKYVSLVPAPWTPKKSHFTGISFVEIPESPPNAFSQNAARPSHAGELILAHRVTNIEDINRRIIAAGVPIIAPLGKSGSGKSMSMAFLDPNGIRVEIYEY